MSDLIEVQKKHVGQRVEKEKLILSKIHKGFGIKLNPNGQHKWVTFFMLDGVRKYKTIGPITIPHRQALDAYLRSKHDKSIVDLIAQQNSEKESPTIREFAQIYIDRHVNVNITDPQETIYKINQIVEQIGDVRIAALSKQDVFKIINNASTKCSGANQCRILKAMYNKAIEFDFIKIKNNMAPINPVSQIKLYTPPARQIVIEENEFRRLWESIELDQNYYASCAILLFTLTGCRKDEILSLKWEHINWEKGYISIKDTKNGRDHQIPITSRIHRILRGLPTEGEHLFPSPRHHAGHLENITKPFQRMKARAKISKNVTIHDLRRSVSTYLLELPGVEEHQVSAALNHKSVVTTRRHYSVISQRKKAQVLGKMSDFYDKFMTDRTVIPVQSSDSSPSAASSSASSMPG